MKPFVLQNQLPLKNAAGALREQLVDHLREQAVEAGEPYYSDADLVKATGLARNTVRRALADMTREGWIERRHGKGTFVGPRVRVPGIPLGQDVPRDAAGTVRVGLSTFRWDATRDWYTSAVLRGLVGAGGDRLSVELFSGGGDVGAFSQQLRRSRPDLFACMPSGMLHAAQVVEAQRQGIPVIVTGTRLLDLRVPTVCEDGEQGAALAVDHLVSQGHRRIGYIGVMDAAPWPWERRAGYLRGLEAAGLEPDERGVCWVQRGGEDADVIMAYLDRYKPTAVLCGGSKVLWHLRGHIQSGALQIPRDLSLVTFDQHSGAAGWLGGVEPTTIAMPLEAMGRKIAELAEGIAETAGDEPWVHRLPCTLVPGGSVASRHSDR